MADHATELQNLYVAYFNRPADPKGLAYWSGVLDAHSGSLGTVSSMFAGSAEYKTAFAGKTSAETVDLVYHHLFGRAAETAGSAYWSNLLEKGTLTVDAVVTAIAKGALTTDLFAYNSKVSVAVAVTNAVDTASEIAAYTGAKANVLGATYLAKVVDETTFKAAIDAHSIDLLVTSFAEANPPAPAGSGVPVELVGLPHHDSGALVMFS